MKVPNVWSPHECLSVWILFLVRSPKSFLWSNPSNLVWSAPCWCHTKSSSVVITLALSVVFQLFNCLVILFLCSFSRIEKIDCTSYICFCVYYFTLFIIEIFFLRCFVSNKYLSFHSCVNYFWRYKQIIFHKKCTMMYTIKERSFWRLSSLEFAGICVNNVTANETSLLAMVTFATHTLTNQSVHSLCFAQKYTDCSATQFACIVRACVIVHVFSVVYKCRCMLMLMAISLWCEKRNLVRNIKRSTRNKGKKRWTLQECLYLSNFELYV